MADQPGRLFLLKKNAVTIGGGRTVGMTVNGATIDNSDQTDIGFVVNVADTIIDSSLEISFEGVVRDKILREIALGPQANRFMDDITLEFPDGDEISGDFVLSNYTETGAYKDSQQLTATLISDGAWTYTPAP